MTREARSRVLSMMRVRSVERSVGRRTLAECGQSVAEMALITPVLLLLLVGTIEIGGFASYGIEVSNAARAGVQYGAQSLVDSKDAAGIAQAARNDAPELAKMNVNATNSCA